MGRVKYPSGAHSARRDDRMTGILQQADENIPIEIIIEVEPHTGSTKNCRACNQACSCALAWQITSQCSWQYANASYTASTGRSRSCAIARGCICETYRSCQIVEARTPVPRIYSSCVPL